MHTKFIMLFFFTQLIGMQPEQSALLWRNRMREAVSKKLEDPNADLNASIMSDSPPIQMLCRYEGNQDLLVRLLEKGALPERQNYVGSNALHVCSHPARWKARDSKKDYAAIIMSHTPPHIVRQMLYQVSFYGFSYCTPLEIAMENDSDLCELYLQHGAAITFGVMRQAVVLTGGSLLEARIKRPLDQDETCFINSYEQHRARENLILLFKYRLSMANVRRLFNFCAFERSSDHLFPIILPFQQALSLIEIVKADRAKGAKNNAKIKYYLTRLPQEILDLLSQFIIRTEFPVIDNKKAVQSEPQILATSRPKEKEKCILS